MRLTALVALGCLLPVASVASGDASVGQITMKATPHTLLGFCQKNILLRPICPARIPAGGSAHDATQGYDCTPRNARHETLRQMRALFATNRCVFAEWDYENGKFTPAFSVGRQLWGWDGRRWVSDEWSLLPPPFHVGIDIQASVGSPRNLLIEPGGWPQRRHPVSDALFDPVRSRPVSLGWVSWYGIRGQLALTPRGPCETGDQLVLYVPPNAARVSYAITLDAWMPAVRVTGKHFDRTYRFQPGPALPRVIATLRSIVGSARRG